jgi:hypothetical protein
VSVADSEVVHIHLLDLRGKRLWSRPTSVETSNSGATVVSLAIDAEESATVLWIRRNERSDPPRKNQFLTQRLSPDGKARWPEAVDLGEAVTIEHSPPRRFALERVGDGVIRAHLATGGRRYAPNLHPYQADVFPDGRVVIHKD